jgi:GNAT superfamily N-acetyltransferase
MLFKQLNANKNTIDKNIIIQRIYKEDSELLADIHVTGFEFEGFDAEQEHLIVKEGYNNEKFQCYIAKIDNNPIGAGSLFVHDTIGVLFGGTTVPQYRGKGGQKALLEYRINEAIDLGCEVLISHTTVNSQSQRNLERVGFQIACHRARWTEIPY